MSRSVSKLPAITGFTAGEMEGNWQATEVGLQVNLGRENRHASGQAPDHAAPFCACCRDMGSHHGGIEHLHQMRRHLESGRRNPTLATLQRLAKILNVAPGYFL